MYFITTLVVVAEAGGVGRVSFVFGAVAQATRVVVVVVAAAAAGAVVVVE